ncbi:hypothetical protein [Nitrosopumilus sp.]|uniref:hypothetical protein n=1 Tax=Nitrosopumilus sp. TaxID=2024843 RepID=UPI003D0C6F22
MNYDELITAIDSVVKNVNTAYHQWTIGITDRPTERKSEHDDPRTWQIWETDSEKIGRDVEEYFKSLGMNGDVGGSGNAGFIYIF